MPKPKMPPVVAPQPQSAAAAPAPMAPRRPTQPAEPDVGFGNAPPPAGPPTKVMQSPMATGGGGVLGNAFANGGQIGKTMHRPSKPQSEETISPHDHVPGGPVAPAATQTPALANGGEPPHAWKPAGPKKPAPGAQPQFMFQGSNPAKPA